MPAMAGDVWISGKDFPLAPGEFTIGNSSSVVRTVTGTVDAGKRYLQYQDDIYREEVIETFEESATELTFVDQSTLSLGPNSAVVLDRFVYNPDSDTNEFVLSITKGVLRFATGKLRSDSYEIHTPVSTIGVRGTVINVAVGDGRDGTESMVLSVIEGEATVYACGDKELTVHEGFSSEISVESETCSYREPKAISALLQEP
ncbi:MAG TPA: FecR domain-containing protein [Kiloniellaceae bacterium]|nr:FecR domain-containing protein [Kiloniellaceae bacterium]